MIRLGGVHVRDVDINDSANAAGIKATDEKVAMLTVAIPRVWVRNMLN